jgi:hypothetical protein
MYFYKLCLAIYFQFPVRTRCFRQEILLQGYSRFGAVRHKCLRTSCLRARPCRSLEAAATHRPQQALSSVGKLSTESCWRGDHVTQPAARARRAFCSEDTALKTCLVALVPLGRLVSCTTRPARRCGSVKSRPRIELDYSAQRRINNLLNKRSLATDARTRCTQQLVAPKGLQSLQVQCRHRLSSLIHLVLSWHPSRRSPAVLVPALLHQLGTPSTTHVRRHHLACQRITSTPLPTCLAAGCGRASGLEQLD